MNRKHLKINYNNLFRGLCVIFAILMSKTYYFGIQYRSTYQFVFWALCALSFFIVRKNLRSSTMICSFTMIALLIFNLLIFFPDMETNQINTVLGHVLTIISVSVLVGIIDSKTFSYLYIKIIGLFCLISIPCFIVAISNPELARQFCQPGYQWPDPAGYSPYYLWGINGMIHVRNSGPFWEPGAFQGFINLGILLLLYNVDDNLIKHRLRYFILFVVTLLTTQSATGYLILILIFLFQKKYIENELFGEKHKSIFRFLIGLILLVVVLYVLASNVITNKIAYTAGQFETVSASMRFNDIKGGISLILKGNIFGLGETPYRDAVKLQFGVNKDDSVGLMAMAYTYGIGFFCVYFISMLYGIKNLFKLNKYRDLLLLLMVFFILHMTEGLWFLPVYLYITLFRKDKLKSIGQQSRR